MRRSLLIFLALLALLTAGCGDRARLDTAPTVSIRAEPAAGTEPLRVQLFSVASGGNGELSYRWDFGDGSEADGAHPIHEFSAAGAPHQVTLTVTDADGDAATSEISIAVGTDETPSAAANASPLSGLAPLQVDFECAVGGGNGPMAVSWSFGDGGSAAFFQAEHTYTAPGTYTATCAARDADGDVASDAVSIVVTAPGAADAGPIADAAPAGDGGLACGEGTFELDGECVPFDPSDETPPTTTADPAGGEHDPLPAFVELSSDEPATIFYTTDGTPASQSSPSGASPVFIGPITDGMTIRFFAVDPAGNAETEKQETYVINQPPPPVGDLQAVLSGTTADLTWSNPAAADLAGVLVLARPVGPGFSQPEDGVTYSVGELLADGSEVIFQGSGTSTSHSGLTPGSYHYKVYAFDTAGAYSEMRQEDVRVIESTQSGTIEVALSPVSATVTTQPTDLTLSATASYDSTNDELTVAVTLDSSIQRYIFNPKLVVTSLNAGTFANADESLGGNPLRYYGPEALPPGISRSRDFTFSGIDGSTDPVIFDVELADHRMLYFSVKRSLESFTMFDFGTETPRGGTGCDSTFYTNSNNPGAGCAAHRAVIGPGGTRIYMGHRNMPNLRVFDPATNAVVVEKPLQTGPFPSNGPARINAVALGPNEAHLYAIVSYGEHKFSKGLAPQVGSDLVRLDPLTLEETGRIRLITDAISGQAYRFAISPDGTLAAIPANFTKFDFGQLYFVDLRTMTLVDMDSSAAGDQPLILNPYFSHRVATFSPDASRVYVTADHDGEVLEVDPATGDVVELPDLFPNDSDIPTFLTFGPNGNLWVARGSSLHNDSEAGIRVIAPANPSDQTEVVTTNFTDCCQSRADQVRFSEDGSLAFVTVPASSDLAFIDVDTLTRIDKDGDAGNGVTNVPLGAEPRQHVLLLTPF